LVLVLDADCLVGGTIAGRGAAHELIDLWRDGAFELIACPHLVAEVRRTLLHPRISTRHGITRDEVEALSSDLQQDSIWLDDPLDPPRVVRPDAGDDYVVAIALAGHADSLVTRDRHFDHVEVAGLEIIPPRAALRRLAGGPE